MLNDIIMRQEVNAIIKYMIARNPKMPKKTPKPGTRITAAPQQLVLYLRFVYDLTLQETADVLREYGFAGTKERVRQIEAKGLRHAKNILRSRGVTKMSDLIHYEE